MEYYIITIRPKDIVLTGIATVVVFSIIEKRATKIAKKVKKIVKDIDKNLEVDYILDDANFCPCCGKKIDDCKKS